LSKSETVKIRIVKEKRDKVVKEVSRLEAKKLIEAYVRKGRLVIDEDTGQQIKELGTARNVIVYPEFHDLFIRSSRR